MTLLNSRMQIDTLAILATHKMTTIAMMALEKTAQLVRKE